MKKITMLLLAVFSTVILSCNDNDDSKSGPDSIIGTWKLVSELTDGTERSLSDCEKEETYIFGTEQLTHELYAGSDDSTDDESDDSGDDESDDSGDDESDDSDDGGDDDRMAAANCSIEGQALAFWTKENSVYNLDYSGTIKSLNVAFTDSKNKFYFEETVVVGGVSRVKRYIFQKQ